MNDPLRAAEDRADEAAAARVSAPEIDGTPARVVAIGDPQASTRTFFAVLRRANLLAESGWLRSDVRLVSIGDHFDFGAFDIRARSARSGLCILSWLAAHSPRHVTLIAGNHDLARVAELVSIDDAGFERAAREADALYRGNAGRRLEAEFLSRYPEFPSIEMVARDVSSFSVAQRELVVRLLREHRFRLAHSEAGVLSCHAGATRDDLDRARIPSRSHDDPDAIAAALNRLFDAAIDAWDETQPFEIPGWFAAGSAKTGEADGFLYHRPAQFDGTAAHRRYDPRRLPLGLVQAVGHVRDPKCRALLGSWVRDAPGPEGSLRHLHTDGVNVSYARTTGDATPSDARLVFIDGGMHAVDPNHYELLDLGSQRAL